MAKKIFLLVAGLFFYSSYAQVPTLSDYLEGVKKNYPLLKQKDIESEVNTIETELNNTARLPQAGFTVQGSYQSDVTSVDVPIPGISIESLDKDQYKAYVDVSQSIYDGGVTRLKNALQDITSQINNSKTDAQLWDILQQTQKYYFSALLADESIAVYELSKKDIKERIKVLETGFKYGTVQQSQIDILRVELLKTDQNIIEKKAVKKASVQIVSLFSGLPADPDAPLPTPAPILELSDNYDNRPEWKTFELEKEQIAKGLKLSNAGALPQFSLFGQGGYGKPGLNMLSNNFDWYYMVGARLRWNLSSFYTLKKNKKLSSFNKTAVEIQQETLKEKLDSQKITLENNIEQYTNLIKKDEEIVLLRTGISKVSATELDNGTITATDYIIEKNAETTAFQSLKLHQVQKLATQYELKHLTGN